MEATERIAQRNRSRGKDHLQKTVSTCSSCMESYLLPQAAIYRLSIKYQKKQTVFMIKTYSCSDKNQLKTNYQHPRLVLVVGSPAAAHRAAASSAQPIPPAALEEGPGTLGSRPSHEAHGSGPWDIARGYLGDMIDLYT